jgi:glycine cleavage system H lipoate-binding protein
MKTAQDFIKELGASADLQNECKTIKDESGLQEFLKRNDVSATVEEFKSVVEAYQETEGEITDDTAEAVAGGGFLHVIFPWWF